MSDGRLHGRDINNSCQYCGFYVCLCGEDTPLEIRKPAEAITKKVIVWLIALWNRLFGKKEEVLRSSTPNPGPIDVDVRERVWIRRNVELRAFPMAPLFVKTSSYKQRKEEAYLEALTPKGAHVVTFKGARMHRKNRDILSGL